MNEYSNTLMTIHELEGLLASKVSPIDFNKIISGYEVSENAFINLKLSDGSPFFFHLTRVARIIISELELFDSDLIIAALLHDYKKICNVISFEILEFNFGTYTAFLIDLLSKSIEEVSQMPQEFHISEIDVIKIPIDDYLIIKLAEQVDNFRALQFTLSYNPISDLCNIYEKYLPFTKLSNNKEVDYLMKEIMKLKNIIVG